MDRLAYVAIVVSFFALGSGLVGCSGGGSKTEACTPGYAGCICTADKLCLQGYNCSEAGLCVADSADGDPDNDAAENDSEAEAEAEAEAEVEADAESEAESEIAVCACPDVSGRYCLDDYTYCVATPPDFATRSDAEPANSAMIIVESLTADPADCQVRVVIESWFGVPGSFLVDRCNWPEKLTFDASGPYLAFDPETKSFAIFGTGPEDQTSRRTMAAAACADYPGEVPPYLVFTLPACPALHCFDTVQNFGESDTDCGEFCAYCANGKACAYHEDCASMTCIDGLCKENVCGDGLRSDDNSEACDDGNTEPGDGCAADCTVETQNGWDCTDDENGKSVCTCNVYSCPTETTDPCAIPICATHGCAFGPRPTGEAAADFAQTPGDCHRLVCTAEQTTLSEIDVLDSPPSTDCIFNYCDSTTGIASTINEPTSKTCTAAGNAAGHCDGNGTCVPDSK